LKFIENFKIKTKLQLIQLDVSGPKNCKFIIPSAFSLTLILNLLLF